MRVVLASASPRRRQLLQDCGLDLVVLAPQVDERRHPGEPPTALVTRLALAKAHAVQPWAGQLPILAADTTVHLENDLFEKPASPEEAAFFLRSLSGRWHTVSTGWAVLLGPFHRVSHVDTEVRFRDLTDAEIHAYVASGEPLDKAGAYGIQGRGGALVAEVRGSYTNVVGLPLEEVLEGLRSAASTLENSSPC